MPQFKKYKLGDIIDFRNGKLISFRNERGKCPIFGGNGIVGFTDKYNSDGETLIIGRVGAFCGNVFYSKQNCWVTDNAIIGKVNRGNSPKYFYYLLSQIGLNNYRGGSSQPLLNQGTLNGIEIEAPSDLPTQTRIAAILSSLDDKIELNRRTNATLEAMAQTLFKKYFVEDIDPDNLPEGWRWGKLSDVAEFSNGNAFSSKELLDKDNGNCFHVFKMGHIKRGGGFNNEGTKSYFSKTKANGLDKYILKKGDLLMCMTDMKDSMALLGHTALMNENDKYIVNQRVGLIRAKNELDINYPFLYLLTNSSEFIEDLRSRANSGVQVNLSTSEIKNSRTIIPSRSINQEFNNAVEPLYEKIFLTIKENEKLIEVRDSLLPKLMSGEIEVNAAENELVS